MNFSQPQTVKTSISIPEKHHLYQRRKGQEVHLFNICSFSVISHCQGIQTMIPLSKRETERMKDRQAVWQREDKNKRSKREERETKSFELVTIGHSLYTEHLLQLFICCCLHRELGCTEAPLTRFFSLSQGESLRFQKSSQQHVCVERYK